MVVSFLLAALLGLSFAPAWATVTVVNTVTTLSGTQPAFRMDVNGNAVYAHDWVMRQFGNTFYLYGSSYNCGYVWQNSTTSVFCGFKVYTSTDLITWTDRGFLFDATTPTWQGRCVGGSTFGCFTPRVVFNAANNNYVMWMVVGPGDTGAPAQFRVFTSPSPLGPFTEQAPPTVVGSGLPGNGQGGPDIFVDDDGTGYISFVRVTFPVLNDHAIYVQRLTSNYLDATGTATAVGNTPPKEANVMFREGSTYYILYGPTCGYCGGTPTQYQSASSPLGTWSAVTQINANSCGGQPGFISKFIIAGSPVYFYGIDVWNQQGASAPPAGNFNQALAAHFWIPLTVGSGTISPFTCSASFTANLTAEPAGVNPKVDQTSGTSGFTFFLGPTMMTATTPRVQTFVAGANEALDAVLFMVAKGGDPCASPCTLPNQPLSVDLVTVDGTGKPTAVLASASVPVASIGFAPRRVTANFGGFPLTSGSTYGIRVQSAYTTGAYALIYNDQTPYPAGNQYFSTNSGSTYTVETGRALGFAVLKFVRGLGGSATLSGTGAFQ